MIVIADGDIIRNRVGTEDGAIFPLGLDNYTQTLYANRDLILNAVNYLVGDDGLLASRSRNIKLRKLDVIQVKNNRTAYQLLNLIAPLLLLGAAGAAIVLTRKKLYTKA